MKIVDDSLLNTVSAEAMKSPRLRMNYNFHQSLEDKCHRFLNAVEPGTVVEIHRHPTKDKEHYDTLCKSVGKDEGIDLS